MIVFWVLPPLAGAQDYVWGPLGPGMDGYVYNVTVFNGELIAGGVPCNYIARWDGSAWGPLGSGMNDTVTTLGVYNGELIAGGYFWTAGSVACNYIARWSLSYQRGDLNCDGSADGFDIDAFVIALTTPSQYAQLYPDCDLTLADCNCDGFVNGYDIDPFVQCLTVGCPACP
jgi:hypothetical protein